MSEQYKSEALAAVHETAFGLHEAGRLEQSDHEDIRRDVPDAGRSVDAGTDTANLATRAGEPISFRSLSECPGGLG